MNAIAMVDTTQSSRDLVRTLRRGVGDGSELLPESVAWQVFLELRRRGEPEAGPLFIGALRSLHSRRSLAGATLANTDPAPEEHRLAEDVFLADLWKAYKRCITSNRTGPASQLLRDIEEQIGAR
jgi:hypothetical protein